MCFIKKILYQYFVFICPAWDSFSSEKNFTFIVLVLSLHKAKHLKKI